MEYQRIAAAGSFRCLVRFLFAGVPGRVLVGAGGFVFGTLLGPEATGPWFRPVLRGGVAGLFVSGFLAAPIMHVVCVGCVVWGCCLRTT